MDELLRLWPILVVAAGGLVWCIRLESLVKLTKDRQDRMSKVVSTIADWKERTDARMAVMEQKVTGLEAVLDPRAVNDFRKEFAYLSRDVHHIGKEVDRLRASGAL